MEINTIIILTAVICFIIVFVIFFILLIQRGAKNAKKGYVFRHRFSGSHPYMNQTEMHYHVCDLIDRALRDKQPVDGIEIRLITKSDGV